MSEELEETGDDLAALTGEVVPGVVRPGKRAYRLREKLRANVPISADDQEWLAQYEIEHPAHYLKTDIGASKSRKVSYTEEETAAVGTGAAAPSATQALAMAQITREEGRRLDTILSQGMNALVRACDLHERMAAILLRERVQDAEANRTLLLSVREHFLARTEAEGELQRQQSEPPTDPINALAAQLLPALLPLIMGETAKKAGKEPT